MSHLGAAQFSWYVPQPLNIFPSVADVYCTDYPPDSSLFWLYYFFSIYSSRHKSFLFLILNTIISSFPLLCVTSFSFIDPHIRRKQTDFFSRCSVETQVHTRASFCDPRVNYRNSVFAETAFGLCYKA